VSNKLECTSFSHYGDKYHGLKLRDAVQGPYSQQFIFFVTYKQA
jgi:hypothetical protein